jgi:hypothetical protein
MAFTRMRSPRSEASTICAAGAGVKGAGRVAARWPSATLDTGSAAQFG